jgi:hypothetical protein
MHETITYAALDRFLTGLGFVKSTTPEPHILYEHVESGTLLPLRRHRPGDRVDPGTLTVVRKFVVDNGLAEPADIEQLFQKSSA